MIAKRRLGNAGPELTTVGFGAWAAGGPWFAGWGAQDDNESVSAIQHSIYLGCNWIDTAAIYGMGHSEEVVGKAIAGRRDEVLVFTKCGRIIGEDGKPFSSLTPQSMRQELEGSLRRLGVESVDLYQIHWPDASGQTPLEESWAEMAKLKAEGKARSIGVSNFDIPLLERCESVAHVDSLQPPYSLLRHEVEADILPWCLKNGTGVIVYSPMQGGLLSGNFDISRVAADDWRLRHPFYQEPKLSENLAFVERLRPIAERKGKTVGQLAIAWTLSHPAVTAAIVGARRPSQVEANVQAMGWELTTQEVQEIERAFLV